MADRREVWTFDDGEPASETFLDCRGDVRHFRLDVEPTPAGPFLYARELHDGEPTGWHMMAPVDEDRLPQQLGEMRGRIRARLATRDLARDPDTGHLRILDDVVRGQIAPGEEPGLAPSLIVDGEEITWDELGALLSSYEGWGVRLRICTAGEE